MITLGVLNVKVRNGFFGGGIIVWDFEPLTVRQLKKHIF